MLPEARFSHLENRVGGWVGPSGVNGRWNPSPNWDDLPNSLL